MTKEITMYILFIMLTVSMGIVFQFMLNKIKILTSTQRKLVRSMNSLHNDLVIIKNEDTRSASIGSHGRINKNRNVLRGDLTLEYQGAIADTRAIFMLDKD
tara:strand:+ start:1064 stop:1366 length:303 start_codon:yes stop_codon:yes gene_type:complete